ncbi:MAG TPA: ribonuclease HII [Thermoprotei archaeon]|nr:ribonuclease HII [Thermoprotei archaeon]
MKNKMKILVGVDEAGRGAVIGPLSITSVAIKSKDEERLAELIRYDSKRYTQISREKIYEEILRNKAVISYYNILIQPATINYLMGKGVNLNVIEIKYIVSSIEKCLKDVDLNNTDITIYIDSMYRDSTKCKFHILNKLHEKFSHIGKFKIVCEHKADEKYVSVKIASIISKVTRDREIKNLHKKYGDFGSGYPSDPKTINFLEKISSELSNDNIYSIVRIYWKTWKKVIHDDVEKN